MEFGCVFASRVGDHDLVELAEALGYQTAWFYDSQMIYSDVYATMALAADRTSRIRLATGVAVPSTRMAPVVAHSIATIAQLAPGRVELGVGAGNTARLTMALPPLKLGQLQREVRTIRALLRGETVTHHAEGVERAVRFLHPDRGFLHLADPIPITISALGPKTLAWAGAEADGHLTWNISPDGLREARKLLAAGAERAGRDAATIPSRAIVPLALLRPGETAASPRILCQLAPFITNFLHVQVEWDDTLLPSDPGLAGVIRAYGEYAAKLPEATRHLTLHEGHLVYARDDEREFLTQEVAQAAALIGEPAAVVEHIRELEEAGLSHFAFQVTDEDPVRQLRDFAHHVMARY